MSRSANVQSIQTLKDFKVAMVNFCEDARNALSGVEMDCRRIRDWLERDQLGYWQMQIKRRNEEVMQARADLHRRKISQQGSDAVSDAEQKEALREAMKRLRQAEEKVALIKKLIPQLHHAIAEYHSHSQPLGDHLTGGFERSLNILERMVLALESYVATSAPSMSRSESSASSSSQAAKAGASTTAGSAAEAESTGNAEAGAGNGATAATAEPDQARPDSTAATVTTTATGPSPAGAGAAAVMPGRT
jgi:hypothetical protein